jgi:hypothetical protein
MSVKTAKIAAAIVIKLELLMDILGFPRIALALDIDIVINYDLVSALVEATAATTTIERRFARSRKKVGGESFWHAGCVWAH